MSLDTALGALRDAKRLIVTSHISPDPDAVGSAGALVLALREMGKTATCYLADAVPDKMKNLADGVGVVDKVPEEDVDLVVIVDTSTRARVGPAGEELFARGKRTLNIDHHISNPNWADLNYVDGTAAASAEILETVLAKLGRFSNPRIPNLLYAGLLDDTGSFRFSNTDPEALECAARLLRAGADPLLVSNELYGRIPLKTFRLRERVQSTLKLFHDGRFGVVSVTQAMLRETGTRVEDTDGIIDELRALDGTVVVALLRELDVGGWKGSLRSKSEEIDVNAVAGTFGGGGHRAAAGCKITGTLEGAIQQLAEAVGKHLPK